MARTHSPSKDFFFCPVCHAELPARAKSCPECGNDAETGWKDYAPEDSEEDFDYNEFVNKEFHRKKAVRPQGLPLWVWLTAVGLLGLFIYAWVVRSF